MNDTATTEIYTVVDTLSLHDALPICFMLQTMGISAAAATMLQGAVLFFVVGTEIFTGYKLRIVKGGAENE